jgi:protein gp37
MHETNLGAPGFAKKFNEPEKFDGRVWEAASWCDLQHTDRIDKPWLSGHNRTIFVSDMGDAFYSATNFEWLAKEVMAPILSEKGQRHNWFWSTRRPSTAAAFITSLKSIGLRWPENLLLMTSAVNDITAKARLPWLMQANDYGVKVGVFIEPIASEVDLTYWLPRLSWVVLGGMTGKYAKPASVDHIRSVVNQCCEAEVPIFFKQWGEWVPSFEFTDKSILSKTCDHKTIGAVNYIKAIMSPPTLYGKSYLQMPFKLPVKQGELL